MHTGPRPAVAPSKRFFSAAISRDVNRYSRRLVPWVSLLKELVFGFRAPFLSCAEVPRSGRRGLAQPRLRSRWTGRRVARSMLNKIRYVPRCCHRERAALDELTKGWY